MPYPLTPPAGDALDVLVVEDDPRTAELLAEFFRRRDLTVTTASDGRAAITAVHREPARFSIVITDLKLPGADGFEVLSAVRAVNASAYVVIITGYATIDSAVRAVREGAYDYLPKPFTVGQLEVMLRRIQDRIALERENRDLTRQVGGGARAAGLVREVIERLDAIDARLATLERLLLREREGF